MAMARWYPGYPGYPKLETREAIQPERRLRGELLEWHGSYGWLKPLEDVGHQLPRERLYVHRQDLVNVETPEPGSEFHFVLYRDAKGLGAADVQSTADSKVVREAKEEEEAPLPLGWKQVWCEEYQEWYFWNHVTKESKWTRPKLGEPEEDKTLPKDWQKLFDVDRGLYYYWNKVTRRSTWDRPGESEERVQETKEAPKDGLPPLVEANGTRIKAKVIEWLGVMGWLRRPEASDDEKIYVNWRDVTHGGNLKTGDDVEFLLCVEGGCPHALDLQLLGRKRSRESMNASEPVKKLVKQWHEDEQLPETEQQDREVPEEPEEPAEEEAPLLPGWEQHWSEDYKRFYYWHRATKQSSWERPALPSGGLHEKAEVEKATKNTEQASKVIPSRTPLGSNGSKPAAPVVKRKVLPMPKPLSLIHI